MSKLRENQFTLAGFMAFVLLTSMVLAVFRYLGPLPPVVCFETIPYGLLALASIVFFRCLRSGLLPWVLVITGNVLFALAVFRDVLWGLTGAQFLTMRQCTAYHNRTEPIGSMIYVVFGGSLLLVAMRMRREATN